ncbi:MAG: alpha/beta hydrolase [Planococcus sp. (in: Bacteria)]|nr:alpha/beta hydrolase [Planococcus sp. (in: firmicutes)]
MIKKIVVIVLGAILALCLLLVVVFIASPKPTAILVQQLFEGGVAVKPHNYDEIEKLVHVENDLSYDSAHQEGNLDIVTPKEFSGKLPVIFWVHGGAFLGGDKSDITEYAVQVASKGFIVVNMNYELAPSAIYPTPLYQVEEAYQFIEKNAQAYGIDMDRLYFAGDSAGAQIISQFVNVQVEEEYSSLIGIEGSVSPDQIAGVLLFCGPYDVSKFGDLSDSFLINFLFDRVGWAYIGERNWGDSDQVKQASVIDHVSAHFPPTFITDGNTGSFEEQGLELADKLNKNDVEIVDVFYSQEEAELGHEYQFIMDTPQAENTFNQLIEFLADTSKK